MGGDLAELEGDAGRCGMVLVTQAEEMPEQEVLELIESLGRRLERRPEAVVVNGLYPPPDDGEGNADDPVLGLWRRRREVNDRELERLRKRWTGPCVELPLCAVDRGPRLLSTLQPVLEEALTRPGRKWS
jgi:hypothetical protein